MPKKRRTNRIYFVSLLTIFIIGLVGIISQNFKDNIVFYYSVSELDLDKMYNKKLRIGGLVKAGSINYQASGVLSFIMSDREKEIEVSYQGIVPDLFRDQQGVVVEGIFTSKEKFYADKLLAKHDENYSPPKLEVK